MKKSGFTLSILAVTVAIMFILVSTTAVIGIRTIKTANYDEYISKLTRVKDAVDLYKIKNKKLPTTGESIVIDNITITDLKNELVKNGDNTGRLYAIDIKLLNVTNIDIGTGMVDDRDVFMIGENSGCIYYLRGYTYQGNKHYST